MPLLSPLQGRGRGGGMGGVRGWTECGEEEESQAQQGLERVIFVSVWARGARLAKRAGKIVGGKEKTPANGCSVGGLSF